MKTGRIYILPTSFGFLFVFGAAIMILVGAAYQNNLVNLLAFFMLSLLFVSMVQTHNNLRDVEIETLEVEGGFAQGDFIGTAVLRNASPDPRYNLEFTLGRKKPRLIFENVHPLVGHGRLKLRVAYTGKKRGVYKVKSLSVHTNYPLGLFRAWVKLPTTTKYFIYPEPIGQKPIPFRAVDSNALNLQNQTGGDDFHGHRAFNPGDPMNHVDWKARARGRPLLVKEFNDGTPQAIFLDYNGLSDIDEEARLSQLAAWIEEIKEKRNPFALHLPDVTIGVGQGPAHVKKCLESLAIHGLKSENGARHGS